MTAIDFLLVSIGVLILCLAIALILFLIHEW